MSQITACIGCLDAEEPLYQASGTYLQETYENLTKISMPAPQFPLYFCVECHHRLQSCYKFRRQCLKVDTVLAQLAQSEIGLNQKSIQMLDRNSLNLQKKLSTTFAPAIDIQPTLTVEIKVENDFKTEELDENSYPEVKVINDVFKETKMGFDGNDGFTSSDEDDVPLIKMVKVEKRKVKRSKNGFKESYAKEILLTREQQLSELAQRKHSQNYLHAAHKCQVCYKGFVDEAAYTNHMLRHDAKTGEFECDICHLRYPSKRQLLGHRAAHARRYQCAECQHRSQTANQAREHEKWHRGHKYECKQCGVTFDKPTSHLTHIRKVHRSLFACEYCGESCVSAHGLRMHQAKTTHNIVEEAAVPAGERHCAECGVQFLNKAAWTRHVLTAVHHNNLHKTAKKCIICKAEFVTNTELLAHLKEHRRELKPPSERLKVIVKFHCDLCPSAFVNKSKLQVHYKRIHLGLKYHKDFVCEVCGKHFKSNATLKYHHRTHTGEKPYPCAECPKRFADKNQLRIHGRVHSGARPYACALCTLTFRQKPALNRHMRVHTGAKPYSCTYCSKAFSQSNSLKLHTRTVHHKLPSNRKKVKELGNEQEKQTGA